MIFDAAQRATLARVCDTLVPEIAPEGDDDPRLFRLKASDLKVATELETVFEELVSQRDQRLLGLFLRLIESGLFNRLTTGQPRAFSQLTLAQRTALLRAWSDSRFSIARRAFQGIKRLTLAIFYATMPDDQPNPTWSALEYAGPPGNAPDSPRPIAPLKITGPTTLHTDVLVIGSGAGGGVVAGELTAAGLDVIVAEKGGYYAECDYHGAERASSERMYERRTVLTTADTGMNVLAGSVLGGGTLVNWTTSLRPPERVLHEWASEYGFCGVASADFQRSLDAVSQRIHINTDESIANPLNTALEAGCRKLGYSVDIIPRNVQGCHDCGYCGFGCPFAAKQSTLRTYLQDAHQRGARFLVNAHADRIRIEHGVAQGAEFSVRAEEHIQQVTVRARAVVVAAGAIHTPALLLRSGLGNAHIGANLHLHPTTLIASLFDEPVIGWRGAPQTRMSRQFADLDGEGYGVWLETAPIHPGLGAQTFPWASGRAHKRTMQRIAHFANIIILTRDRYAGRVTLDRAGQPVMHYKLHRYDARHMMRGLLEAIRIHEAAGATLIYGPHQHLPGYHRGDDLRGFLARVEAAGFATNAFGLFSAHQMSTCRIGGSSAIGALAPNGETYEVKNLFVADASVLPNAPGVNPMLTIMAAAHHIAQGMKSKFA